MLTVAKYFLFFILFLVAIGTLLAFPQKPSFWGDELGGGVSFLKASSIKEFLWVQGSVGPEVAPIYPLLLYFSSKYFHISPNHFRFFSAFCCVLSCFFIYLTLSKLTEKKTAFFTSISISMAPIHLWYSMLLRPHALAFLLSIVSFYIFTILNKNNPVKIRYIFILCVINTALILTHYIFFWITFAECLYLVVNKKFNKKNIFFIALNSALIGGVILYLGFCVRSNNIDFVPEKGIKQMLFMVLGLLDFEIPSINSWGIYLQPLFFVHRPMPPWLSFLLETAPFVIIYGGNILLSILLLYLTFKQLWSILKKKTLPSDITFYLLFFGVILPIIFAGCQIISGANILMARYFYLSWVCKIALLYMCLNQVKSRNIRNLLFVVALFFFVHHYALYKTCLPYSDWDSCAQYLQEEISDKDIIITGRFEESLTLAHVLSDSEKVPIVYSNSIKSAIDGVSFLQEQYPSSHIWLIYSMQWNSNIPCIMREELKQQNFDFHEKVFPPFEGIVCYKIYPKTNKEVKKAPSLDLLYKCDENYYWNEEKKNRQNEMRKILLEAGYSKFNMDSLIDLLVFPDGTVGLNTIPHLTFQFSAMGKKDEIFTLCNYFSNQVIWANVGLIFLLSEQKQFQQVEEIFNKLIKKNFYTVGLLKPMWEDYAEGRTIEFNQKCKQLKEAGFPLAYILETVVHLKKESRGQEIIRLGVLPFNKKAEMLLSHQGEGWVGQNF